MGIKTDSDNINRVIFSKKNKRKKKGMGTIVCFKRTPRVARVGKSMRNKRGMRTFVYSKGKGRKGACGRLSI